MKAKTIGVVLVASAALSAVSAFADECSSDALHSRDAHDKPAVHAMNTAHRTNDVPDAGTSAVGGDDTYRTQSGKREQHDSIDASYRGG
ncbi:hypothetical protein AWB76_01727 [Caballeronia temeraria]|uniref:Uncharacterized protein n=1 Tax=Caballeronia temeraria TaxID=1777137 RepID=A0A158A493_9BURK|nr:hypothetical protein [Caballeronia temeraria]SAK52555.1 hypothetical protein AWB76_01727 [Caballeronia temeraria]